MTAETTTSTSAATTTGTNSPTSVVANDSNNVDSNVMETDNVDPTLPKPKALVDEEDFGDKDDDDGEPEAMDTTTTTSSVVTKSSSNDDTFSPEILRMYYSRLFPFSLLYSWLNYKKYDPTSLTTNTSTTPGTKLFSNREFSFTIEPMKGEEIYIRYQSFSTQKDLMDSIKKRNPVKIDIGAVFSNPPKDSKSLQGSSGSSKFQPIQRELVFDIDLTDYDDIRKCGCTGAQICHTCWTFMTCAARVMHEGLQDDFGFQHIAWFYSGRRGVHCWVCDESARKLTNDGRNAVASYFEVALGNERNQDVQLLSGSQQELHPALQRSYQILEPMFVQFVLPASGGHGLLATKESWETNVLNALPDSAAPVRDLLLKKWTKDLDKTTPEQKWEQLKQHLEVFLSREDSSSGRGNKSRKKLTNTEHAQLKYWPCEMVFKYTYPRLDINVSKTMNHLLKSPFCIHPKTGRVCVPIDITKIESFDPFVVPTVSQLMKELDAIKKDDNDSSNSNAALLWQKTSLKEYFTPFQKQFLEPMLKEFHQQNRDLAEEQAAIMGDF